MLLENLNHIADQYFVGKQTFPGAPVWINSVIIEVPGYSDRLAWWLL
jgi:hypothetical protein